MAKNGYKIRLSQDMKDPEWDAFLSNTSCGEYQQTSLWAQVKSIYRWHPIRVVVTRDEEIIAGGQILTRRIPLIGSVGYVSKGPCFAMNDPELLRLVIDKLRKIAREHRIEYLIVHPPDNGHALADYLIRGKFQQGSIVNVPTATLKIDLSMDLQDILANMEKRNRRFIRRGERKGIKVREGSKEDIGTFYHLMLTSCRRRGVSPNPADEAYFDELWRIFYPHGYIRLFLAEYEGEVLSGALVIPFGNTVRSWKVGWSGHHGDRQPNQILNWETIKWSKRNNYCYFDFMGIDPNAAKAILQGNHFSEVARGSSIFKLMFGGQVSLLPDAYEYIYNPFVRLAYTRFLLKMKSWPLVQTAIGKLGWPTL